MTSNKLRRPNSVTTRMTLREKHALALMAAQDDRSPSEMVRELVRQEAVRRGVWEQEVK